MAKILVTDSNSGTQVPFLRGILTRTLQDSGLPFEAAYELASQIRQDLDEKTSISTEALRALVMEQLTSRYSDDIARRYEARFAVAPIVVRDAEGLTSPLSRALHQQGLEASGLIPDEAAEITTKIYRQLAEQGCAEIASYELGRMSYTSLLQEFGEAAAHRYLVWTDFIYSGRTLVLLIGGTAGCGKSTTATFIANRLDIVRTQSTDMLREIMRVLVPQRLIPVLHRSSFDAWRALPGHEDRKECSDTVFADGFRAQAEPLSVACEAVLQRALRERVSLILEGVHMQPAFLDRIPEDTDALVVPVMLAVLDPAVLRQRIRGRGRDVPQRRAERYLKHFDDIWRLQSFLLSEADRAGVPMIENTDREKLFREIMLSTIGRLSDGFSRSPDKVFRKRKLPTPSLELS